MSEDKKIVIDSNSNLNSDYKYSVLSDKAINYYRSIGDILIEPYDPKNLNNCSYDVNLAKDYYEEVHPQNKSNLDNDSSFSANNKHISEVRWILFPILTFITFKMNDPILFSMFLAAI